MKDIVNKLKERYGTTDDATLAKELGISVAEIEFLATQLALGKDKRHFKNQRMPRWTASELDKLRDLYPSTPNVEIARQLGRTTKSVVSKAHKLGLKKTAERLEEMGRQNVKERWARE